MEMHELADQGMYRLQKQRSGYYDYVCLLQANVWFTQDALPVRPPRQPAHTLAHAQSQPDGEHGVRVHTRFNRGRAVPSATHRSRARLRTLPPRFFVGRRRQREKW